MRTALVTLPLLLLLGCDPCSGLAEPPTSTIEARAVGVRLEVHLPQLGEIALKRWRAPDRGGLSRTALTDAGLIQLHARPFRLRIDADPHDPEGLVVRGAVEVTVSGLGGAPSRYAADVEQPVRMLVQATADEVTVVADPRVVASVRLPDDFPEALRVSATHLVAELPPRVLAGRPLLTVRHAPVGVPRITSDDMTLRMIWPARRHDMGPGPSPFAAPSIGNSAALSVDVRELVADQTATIPVDGLGTFEATLLAAETRRGRIWTTVRLQEAGRCSWAEVEVPVGPTTDTQSGVVALRGLGSARLLRAGGGLSRDLPAPKTITSAAVTGSQGLLVALERITVTGPAGTPTRGVLSRTGGSAIIKEINLAGLGGAPVTPVRRSPSLPKGR